jgi:hypothetical protein
MIAGQSAYNTMDEQYQFKLDLFAPEAGKGNDYGRWRLEFDGEVTDGDDSELINIVDSTVSSMEVCL